MNSTYRYPTPLITQAMTMNTPLDCLISEVLAKRIRTTAAEAYGGTVRSCEIALLWPKVAIIVGKNAEIDASAVFRPKYITPQT